MPSPGKNFLAHFFFLQNKTSITRLNSITNDYGSKCKLVVAWVIWYVNVLKNQRRRKVQKSERTNTNSFFLSAFVLLSILAKPGGEIAPPPPITTALAAPVRKYSLWQLS